MNRFDKIRTRRQFLGNVGSGMLVAGVGASLAADLGCSPKFAFESDDELTFGKLDSLVDMMQELPAAKLQVRLVESLKNGSLNLDQMIAAAALANAQTFGGEDYVGYHAEMALVPALEMAREMPKDRQALPVLKVLYRNTDRIQKVGGKKKKTLKPIKREGEAPADISKQLRDFSRKHELEKAEALFATTKNLPVDRQFNALLTMVEDDINVHRFVLAHRGHELIDLLGEQHAHTILRQCVRYCVYEEKTRINRGKPESPIRKWLPKLIDQYKLASKDLGTRDPGDKWVEETSFKIFNSNQYQAAEIAAAALSEGIAPDTVAEAIVLGANHLVLRQGASPWRTHGASAGVHGTDAANAWRNIIKSADKMNIVGGLIVAAYHTGHYQSFQNDPYPVEAHLEKVKTTDGKELLGIAEEAIRTNDQPTSAAAIHVYGEQGYDSGPVFDLMRRFAISEDGRLHSEKYYRTVVEEFATTRKPLRWRYLVALARVTASAYGYDPKDKHGYRAAGYEDACDLLGVDS